MFISTQQFKSALSAAGVLQDGNIELLSFMFYADDCEVTAPQLTHALGYGTQAGPANSILGNLGKRIAKFLELQVPALDSQSPGWWQVVATGDKKTNGFTWQIRSELADPLIELDLLFEPTSRDYPELVKSNEVLLKGAVRTVKINAYERNSAARKLCIAHYGCACAVCAFKFEDKYGDLGKGFILVHHLKELAFIGQEYQVHPIKDLRPVCPNCHAMLHRAGSVLSISELQAMLKTEL